MDWNWQIFAATFFVTLVITLLVSSFYRARAFNEQERYPRETTTYPFTWKCFSCEFTGMTTSCVDMHTVIDKHSRWHKRQAEMEKEDSQHPEGSGQDTHYVWSCGYCAFRVHADTSTDLDNAIGNHQFHRHGK